MELKKLFIILWSTRHQIWVMWNICISVFKPILTPKNTKGYKGKYILILYNIGGKYCGNYLDLWS